MCVCTALLGASAVLFWAARCTAPSAHQHPDLVLGEERLEDEEDQLGSGGIGTSSFRAAAAPGNGISEPLLAKHALDGEAQALAGDS